MIIYKSDPRNTVNCGTCVFYLFWGYYIQTFE